MDATAECHPSTQRVLNVPELCSLFASYLPRRDLVKLALTKKSFEVPALDWLWRDTPNLIHLLALLPSEVVNIDGFQVRSSFMSHSGLQLTRSLKVTVLQQPAKEDWDRFDEHARRVRTLLVDQITQRPKISMEDVELLRNSYLETHLESPKALLVPNITNLVFAVRDDVDAPLLGLLMGPRLRQLSLSWWRTDLDRTPFLHALTQHSSRIQSLRLRFWEPATSVRSSDLVKLMPSLATLVVVGDHGSTRQLVRKLAAVESLRSLIVNGGSEDADLDYGAQPDLDSDAFQSLETLETAIHSASTILYPPQLTQRLRRLTISVDLPLHELHAAVSNVFRFIGLSCRNLTALTVRIRNTQGTREPTRSRRAVRNTPAATTIRLAPLLAVTNLVELSVYDYSDSMVPWLSDEEKAQVATSWRSLSTFHWQSRVSSTPTNMSMLQAFANCECLQLLTLPLDARIFVKDFLVPFKRRVVLDVADWIISGAVATQVATSILRMKTDSSGPLLISHNPYDVPKRSRAIWKRIECEMQDMGLDLHGVA